MLNKNYVLAVLVVFLLASCVNKKQENDEKKRKYKVQECTKTWYKQVESKVITGDEHGYGPTIGSYDWKVEVEFRLGLKENRYLPRKESRKWCDYINYQVFNKNKN